jgi:hypothetical protein
VGRRGEGPEVGEDAAGQAWRVESEVLESRCKKRIVRKLAGPAWPDLAVAALRAGPGRAGRTPPVRGSLRPSRRSTWGREVHRRAPSSGRDGGEVRLRRPSR